MADVSLLQTGLVSLGSALVGGAFVHFLAGRRDKEAKRRELVTKHLIDIWNDLDIAGNPKSFADSTRMERAISNIQLFGTEQMIKMARANALEFSAKGKTDNLEILSSLRDELRTELGLSPTSQKYLALRIMAPDNEKQK
jgi:hypothetical protein